MFNVDEPSPQIVEDVINEGQSSIQTKQEGQSSGLDTPDSQRKKNQVNLEGHTMMDEVMEKIIKRYGSRGNLVISNTNVINPPKD